MPSQPRPRVTLYSDGACLGNPGPGGWAAILLFGDHQRELCGGVDHTTNQRMELIAAIQGLQQLKTPCRVEAHTDSAYLAHAFDKGWLDAWVGSCSPS